MDCITLMWTTSLAILIGIALDFAFGDPRWLPHPVVFMGKLIDIIEKKYRKKHPSDAGIGTRRAGRVMWGLVIAVTTLLSGAVVYVSILLGQGAYLLVSSIICYQCMASKSLKNESMKVYKAINNNDIEGARYAVSMIVGRDTSALDGKGIIKAAVETVAENTSDGCVAPLFYMILGGPILGLVYKAVNTMDSMVGYKNDKYIDYGRCAAKMDDIFNYLPSRIAAWNMIIAAFVLRLDSRAAYKIYKRDRYKSTSPNSGQTEAVCAGAFDVELLGDAVYFGKTVHKPTMGDANRSIENEDIKRVNKLMYATVLVSLVLMMSVRVIATLLLCF